MNTIGRLFLPNVNKRHEALVQHELYRLLKNEGFNVIPEYRIKADKSKGIRGGRLDLIVLNSDGSVLCAIEVKDKKTKLITGKIQYEKYKAVLGEVPLLYCFNYKMVPLLVIQVTNLSQGKPVTMPTFS